MKYTNTYADKKLKDELEIDGDCVKGYRGGAKSIKIPEGIKEIAESAFMGERSLTEIILPESLTKIGDHAFGWCDSLKEITIPKSALLDEFAFAECEVKINRK